MLLMLDNYDSFTYNLAQHLGVLGAWPTVIRNDALSLSDVRRLAPERVVLSPGPGNPERREVFGVCREVVLELGGRVPILGVCLGHQGIAAAFGARIVRAPQPMHGKASPIEHSGEGLFRGLPPRFSAMRYHSLSVDEATLPPELAVTARSDDGTIMAIAHRTRPIYGLQFHPESIGTGVGLEILRHFLEGVDVRP